MVPRRTRQAKRFFGSQRALRLELLEERCVLDAAVVAADGPGTDELPWHNSLHRLDVNNDGVTSPRDLLAIINRINDQGTGDLAVPPPTTVTNFYDTTGDNQLSPRDLLNVINGLLTPPTVEVSMLTPFTVDVTPQVTVDVTPASGTKLTNGTVVDLDVDLNNDGDFNDPGELSHTQSTLYNGQSTFDLTPALTNNSDLYSVRLRARVANSDAVPGTSDALPVVVDTRMSTALSDYVYADDPSYAWERKGEPTVHQVAPGLSYTYYTIDMTSQTWRSAADVNKPVWHHWLNVYVPNGAITNTAMLLIDGGSNGDFENPQAPATPLGVAAVSLQSVVIDLTDVPSEPLIFTDETSSRSEDAIIAYSYDKFMNTSASPATKPGRCWSP